MRKTLTLTFAFVLASTMAAFAADNTLGTWKFNAAKSKAPPAGVSPIAELTLTREARDGGVTVTAKGHRADGSKIDTVASSKYDGKPVTVTGTGLTWDTAAGKRVSDNAFTEERTKQGTKYHTTVRYVVSADGKTMTATAKGINADGKPVSTRTVFDKQ
jgi:hypothetical protein